MISFHTKQCHFGGGFGYPSRAITLIQLCATLNLALTAKTGKRSPHTQIRFETGTYMEQLFQDLPQQANPDHPPESVFSGGTGPLGFAPPGHSMDLDTYTADWERLSGWPAIFSGPF
jgi:hypothetical protein